MKVATYEKLETVRTQHGSVFGKLCQKLLAIAFQQAGFSNVVERTVQGVDITASDGGEKFAVEVKTTESLEVSYESKDAEGLKSWRKDGYRPALAVLQIRLLGEWLIAKADTLEPGQILVDALRAYRLKALEERVRPRFEKVVEEHYEGARDGGLEYLDEVLKARKRASSASTSGGREVDR